MTPPEMVFGLFCSAVCAEISAKNIAEASAIANKKLIFINAIPIKILKPEAASRQIEFYGKRILKG